jgi:predicted kinase
MGGVAGSGKSTYAKAYAEKHPNTHIIDTDETRKRITGSYHIFTDPISLIWDAMIADANNYLETHEDCIVIIDSTFLTDERRMY